MYPHRLHRRRKWNDLQIIRSAEIVGDVAQIMFATFFIPFFAGETSLILSFYGLSIALVLWWWSLLLLKRCRG